MGKQKINCRFFTPTDVVKKMLDILEYKEHLYGKKILENSCGNGSFLLEIVTRYIEDCRDKGYTDNQIRAGLERDIYGFEIDVETYQICLQNLNNLAAKYSLTEICWRIRQEDVLKAELDTDFFFVVGNPPYITYSALSVEDRNYLKEAFYVCKDGKPDYYYAFIESGVEHMNDLARLVYLVPSNFFKTRFAQKLREYMLPFLTDVYDYKARKIFDSALTSSAIVVCNKSCNATDINYHDMVDNRTNQINKEILNERWVFHTIEPQQNPKTEVRFGDLFQASSSIATLYNAAFVISPDNHVTNIVESEVLRKAASPKSLASRKAEHIIFPYYFDDEGNLHRYSEESFIAKFPNATAHLKTHEKRLNARDSDETAKWFEYGRSQALSHINQEKLLLSTLVTKKVRVYELDENTVPYSGIYLVSKSDHQLSEAKSILESEAFFSYAKKVGIQANGTSIRISINDINNYQFSE